MGVCACAVERRLVVCARNNCWKCKPQQDVVPEDCEYEILHPLETFKGGPGVENHPRRSGKTTRLVEVANYMAKFHHRVYMLTRSQDMVNNIERGYGLDKSVMVFSQHTAGKHLTGMPPGYVLSDELDPEELANLRAAVQRNVLVAAWYTR